MFKCLFWRKAETDFLSQAKRFAHKYKWQQVAFQEKDKLISFTKTDEKKQVIRLNVYYTTQTVGTALSHPYKGKTQLFRKDVSIKELEELFKNPRKHTGKGYYTKK